MFRRGRDTESLYRRGVLAWQNRDLSAAVESLQAALAARKRPDDDGWWFSASRALAQVAMEQDDLQTAALHLAALPGHGVGDAQQHALRAHHYYLRGQAGDAEIALSAAVSSLNQDDHREIGVLMNGAIALMWCGEVLVDLGYGHEAARQCERARQRTITAGVPDAILDAGLAMVEAGAARLLGDTSAATSRLAAIDTSMSPELDIQMTAEKARLAWGAGDQDSARSLYRRAIDECGRLQYPALARLLEAEAATGPAPARVVPYPVEEWAERRLAEEAGKVKPYAVVAYLVVDRPLDEFFAVGQAVEGLLEANPELGVFDGTGTDGEIWELFLDGEDPDALWEAVASLVTPLAGHGSRVDLHRQTGTQTLPLP